MAVHGSNKVKQYQRGGLTPLSTGELTQKRVIVASAKKNGNFDPRVQRSVAQRALRSAKNIFDPGRKKLASWVFEYVRAHPHAGKNEIAAHVQQRARTEKLEIPLQHRWKGIVMSQPTIGFIETRFIPQLESLSLIPREQVTRVPLREPPRTKKPGSVRAIPSVRIKKVPKTGRGIQSTRAVIPGARQRIATNPAFDAGRKEIARFILTYVEKNPLAAQEDICAATARHCKVQRITIVTNYTNKSNTRLVRAPTPGFIDSFLGELEAMPGIIKLMKQH